MTNGLEDFSYEEVSTENSTHSEQAKSARAFHSRKNCI